MSELRKNLGFAQGLALYLAAVLGTGILVVPLLGWREGGPSSLVAWVVLGFLGLALAWTFASAGTQAPDAGGIQAMIGRVFGSKMQTISKYVVFFSVPAGAVPGAYIFAYHVSAAFLLGAKWIPILALLSWILVATANYFGIRVSANSQLVLSGLLVALLTLFIFVAFPSVRRENFHPFLTKGWSGIGNAGVIIFWSFLGWEAIAHLAEEFRDPKKDMIRSALVAAVIVAVFYFAISFVLIGAGVFYSNTGQDAPLVAMAQRMFGNAGRIFTGVLAAVICLGTMNAYMAGLSRLAYSMSREGDLPGFIAKLDPQTGTPRNAVLFLLFLNCSALCVEFYFRFPLSFFFLIQNVGFLLLYVFGCLSAAWLLRGNTPAVVAACFSAAVCALMLPFSGGLVFYPIVVVIAALIRIHFKKPTPTHV